MTSPAAAKGAMLDGVVRTVPQAEGLSAMLRRARAEGRHGALFDVDDDELVQRLGARTVCESCQTPYTGREPGTALREVRRNARAPQGRRARGDPQPPRGVRAQTAPVIEWYEAATRTASSRSTRWTGG